MLAIKPVALAMLAALALPAWAADAPAVAPYRPSISNPAELPTPGQLELAFSGLHEKMGSRRSDSLPCLFKLGFSKEWGVLLGGDAHFCGSAMRMAGARIVNLDATHIGAPEEGSGRAETSLAAALSMPLNRNWTGIAEWSGTRRSGAQSTAQVLAAVSL